MKVLFIDATPGFSPDRKDTKACGGILNSLSIIPKYLASKGWDVTVKSDYPEKCEIDGVKYEWVQSREAMPKWDITVLNRNGVNNHLVGYSKSIGAKIVWWLHDIVDFRYLDDASYIHVDKVIALSEYCKKSFGDFYTIPKDKFVVIPNGVDTSVFYPGPYEERKKYSMIMASALIKGYSPIRDTWLNVRRHFPTAELTIYSSQTLHDKEDNDVQRAFLHEMEVEGARVQRPIPQSILADKMRRAWALLMPNTYPEICSNLMLQARACGLPVITSNIGSASEFIEHEKTGILTPNFPHDQHWWIKGYIESTVRFFKNDPLHKYVSESSPDGIQTWDQIGGKWHEALTALL